MWRSVCEFASIGQSGQRLVYLSLRDCKTPPPATVLFRFLWPSLAIQRGILNSGRLFSDFWLDLHFFAQTAYSVLSTTQAPGSSPTGRLKNPQPRAILGEDHLQQSTYGLLHPSRCSGDRAAPCEALGPTLETMANFFIRRLRDTQQEKFRWSPQTNTAVALKPADYQDDGEVEAASPYQAWQLLRDQGSGLRVGDVLVAENGQTHICRYSGFETAEWLVTEAELSLRMVPSAESKGDSLL